MRVRKSRRASGGPQSERRAHLREGECALPGPIKSAAEPSYRALVEAMPDGAVTAREDGTVLYCNGCFARLVDRPRAKVVGSSLHQLVAPGHRPGLSALLQAGQLADEQGEVELRQPDGHRVPVSLSVRPLGKQSERILCLVVTDLTEQKRAEVILASEQFAEAVLAQAAEAIIVCDQKGRVLRASGAAERLCPQSPLFRPFGEAYPLEYPGFGDASWSVAGAVLRGELFQGLPSSLIGRDGQRHHLLLSAGPLQGAGGRVQGCVITLTDITRLRAAEAELQGAVSVRDEFISIASHELRSPLTALQLVVQGLQRRPDGGPERRSEGRKLSLARRQIDRLNGLIERLLTMTRISSGRMVLSLEPLDLGEVAGEVVERVREEAAAAGCEVRWSAMPALVGLWDRVRLEQVVMNLLSNAIRYAPGKPIEITVERCEGMASLSVADGGEGIEPEHAGRIFEKFERGIPGGAQGGLGLGLYITRQIVGALGGQIEVANRLAGGARFTVRLPLQRSTRAAARAGRRHRPPRPARR